MIVEVPGKVQESLVPQCWVEEVGMRKITKQTKTERIPLMDISMGEQLNRSSGINATGLKDKENWKQRARKVGTDKNLKEQHEK